MALAQDCDDFYLHFSSSDAESGSPSSFSVNLPAPRTLTGKWKMALKEVTYTKWSKEKSYNDPMEFFLFAREEDTVEFREYYNWLVTNSHARPVYEFSKTAVIGVPNIQVVSFYKVPGDPSKGLISGPEGEFLTAEQYMNEVNRTLTQMMTDGHFNSAPYLYMVDKGHAFKTVVNSWNYAMNHWRKVGIMPFVGIRNRHLLGMPKGNTDPEMKSLINKAMGTKGRWPDVEMTSEGFTQATDNMFVLCNLVRTTGVQTDIRGSILRNLPPKPVADGTVVSHDFTEDYYEVTPKQSFYTVTLKLVNNRDYRDINFAHPTSFTLHFMPIDECQPQAKRILV